MLLSVRWRPVQWKSAIVAYKAGTTAEGSTTGVLPDFRATMVMVVDRLPVGAWDQEELTESGELYV